MRFSVAVVGLFAAVASAQSETASAVSSAESSVASDVSSITSAASGASSTVAASTSVDVGSLTSVSIDPAQSSAQAAITDCLKACSAEDVNCQAKCIAVPSPDTQNVNKTTECVAACPQGNGTATDNLNYANCVNDCIAQYYYTTTGTPNLASSTGASGSGATATPSVTQVKSTVTSDGSTFVTSFSSTVAASGSGSANSASSTSSSSAAADMLFSPVGSGIGLFSFLAAFLAL
ncbi:uncharacterized protein GGS22DRAFT_190692 [Annulohypoxylon maeteangense]|uniref:uncharacterized protein n=1 Tax=Annulohypoxylon maeteangense TaxID=1927788 RepID=UPI00200877D1|nr:uncharacterized protein GGS22DRAFT_190692 [Annulohypoxylon maeteangense]KAI0882711.1 hypothetical protein GGS22DRAFT_190692 [Annulohypoxylon maeteangense]